MRILRMLGVAAIGIAASVTSHADEAKPTAGAAASAEAAPLAAGIQAPGDPVAKAAFDALDKHCSRCHQDGMLLHVKAPQKNFGDVLQFDKLAADPNFVVPGNPDASKLVQKILNKEMPADYWSGSSLDATPVSPEEFAAIRNWIMGLGSAQVACTQPLVTPKQMVDEMERDLGSLDKTRAFTDLGDYNQHLTRAITTRSIEVELKPVAQPPGVTPVAATDTVARTAITLTVK